MNLVVIDYGLCNMLSVSNALEYLGVKASVSSQGQDIAKADALILPGVGAFADGMRGLAQKNLIGPIQAYAQSGKPLLGICLGAQMLLSTSMEFGRHDGLNIIPGEVLPLREILPSHLRTPHIGWSGLYAEGQAWDNSILEGLVQGAPMYFVHSFYLKPNDPKDILAVTQYGPTEFASVISHGNVFGCQFHPEKSGEMGLSILNNFVQLAKKVTL